MKANTAGVTLLKRFSAHDLLQRSQNNDLEARHELVLRYKSVIFSTANRMVSNRQDAEDLATDIYLHVFRVINSCKDIQTLPGWIKRVAINVVYQAWRRKGRQPVQASLETVVETCGEAILRTDETQDPAVIVMKRVEQEQRRERLTNALQSLPVHQRTLCELYYAQRRSFEEIAHETGLAIGTIKSRLFRAREALHRKLGDLVST